MLIAFDFDGTLSDSEMTVLLGRQRGVADEMAAITERAMNDEIDYATSLRERAALLEGLPEAKAEKAWGKVKLRPGSAAVIDALRQAGHTVAILTGGFESGVEAALERAGTTVDTVVANRLPVEDGEGEPRSGSGATSGQRPRVLTGEVEGPLIEGTKDTELETLATNEGIPMAETVAVGDGANDLPMLQVAGLAVGFAPKPAVEPHCDTVVESMDELLALFEERDIV